ncbi:hypothetical protein ACPV5O_24960 [Vibrio maritimus]|uniref:hypothetical protein n=1 Tax=Vibrio maritimus TaxID=990268 RepID=UPI0040690C25
MRLIALLLIFSVNATAAIKYTAVAEVALDSNDLHSVTLAEQAAIYLAIDKAREESKIYLSSSELESLQYHSSSAYPDALSMEILQVKHGSCVESHRHASKLCIQASIALNVGNSISVLNQNMSFVSQDSLPGRTFVSPFSKHLMMLSELAMESGVSIQDKPYTASGTNIDLDLSFSDADAVVANDNNTAIVGNIILDVSNRDINSEVFRDELKRALRDNALSKLNYKVVRREESLDNDELLSSFEALLPAIKVIPNSFKQTEVSCRSGSGTCYSFTQKFTVDAGLTRAILLERKKMRSITRWSASDVTDLYRHSPLFKTTFRAQPFPNYLDWLASSFEDINPNTRNTVARLEQYIIDKTRPVIDAYGREISDAVKSYYRRNPFFHAVDLKALAVGNSPAVTKTIDNKLRPYRPWPDKPLEGDYVGINQTPFKLLVPLKDTPYEETNDYYVMGSFRTEMQPLEIYGFTTKNSSEKLAITIQEINLRYDFSGLVRDLCALRSFEFYSITDEDLYLCDKPSITKTPEDSFPLSNYAMSFGGYNWNHVYHQHIFGSLSDEIVLPRDFETREQCFQLWNMPATRDYYKATRSSTYLRVTELGKELAAYANGATDRSQFRYKPVETWNEVDLSYGLTGDSSTGIMLDMSVVKHEGETMNTGQSGGIKRKHIVNKPRDSVCVLEQYRTRDYLRTDLTFQNRAGLQLALREKTIKVQAGLSAPRQKVKASNPFINDIVVNPSRRITDYDFETGFVTQHPCFSAFATNPKTVSGKCDIRASKSFGYQLGVIDE